MDAFLETLESYLRAYSVLWLSALLLGVVAYVLLRQRRSLGDWIALGTLAAVLVVAWLVLHPRPSRLSGDAAAVLAQIGQGTPVLLEFQSPFCISCTLLRPTVDEIEQRYMGRLIVLRVNIQSAVGRELTNHFDFEYTPTFIFFDAQGREQWRSVGGLDVIKVQTSLEQP